MGTETDSAALPSILCAYMQTAHGQTVSAELRDRIALVLAPDQLGPLVRTVDNVHAVRMTLEKLDELRAQAKRGKEIVSSATDSAEQAALTGKYLARP